jgi:hypothetical protein
VFEFEHAFEFGKRVRPAVRRNLDPIDNLTVLHAEPRDMRGPIVRGVVVLDENDKVLLSQLVPEITSEPDYAAVSNALGR